MRVAVLRVHSGCCGGVLSAVRCVHCCCCLTRAEESISTVVVRVRAYRGRRRPPAAVVDAAVAATFKRRRRHRIVFVNAMVASTMTKRTHARTHRTPPAVASMAPDCREIYYFPSSLEHTAAPFASTPFLLQHGQKDLARLVASSIDRSFTFNFLNSIYFIYIYITYLPCTYLHAVRRLLPCPSKRIRFSSFGPI